MVRSIISWIPQLENNKTKGKQLPETTNYKKKIAPPKIPIICLYHGLDFWNSSLLTNNLRYPYKQSGR